MIAFVRGIGFALLFVGTLPALLGLFFLVTAPFAGEGTGPLFAGGVGLVSLAAGCLLFAALSISLPRLLRTRPQLVPWAWFASVFIGGWLVVGLSVWFLRTYNK